MLAQYDHNGILQPVSYCSKVFTPTQTRWHMSEQELFSIIYCCERWQHLLRQKKFIIHTDHKNLQSLLNRAKDFGSGKLLVGC